MTRLWAALGTLAVALSFTGVAASGAADMPGESLYQLPVTLTTADGTSMKLSELRGRPLILTMFYSRCAGVCPMLTVQLQRICGRLSAAERRRMRVLMVSFDSGGDTSETLGAFAREHHITGDGWVIARASAGDVRLLAAALGIQYRLLSNGTFNHSSVFSVTDREGVVRSRTSDLADSDGSFVTSIRRQLGSLRAPSAR